MITGIINIIGFLKTYALMVLQYLAIRILLITALTLILPVVMYNVLTLLIQELLEYMTTYMTGLELEGSLVELTDIAGYLGAHLKIVESLSLILAALNIHFILSFIRR